MIRAWLRHRYREWRESFVILPRSERKPMTVDPPPPVSDGPGPDVPASATRPYAQLEYGDDGTRVPYATPSATGFGRIVKHSMTKKSRTDLSRRMIGMCQLSGWQSTTLNPDMSDTDKLAIVTARFGVIAADSADRDALYGELIELSAATVGWAQGIARHQARERKRKSREARRAQKAAKRKGKGGKDNDG